MPRFRQSQSGRFEVLRGGAGLVHVRFDAREMIRLTERVIGEAARIDAASRDANAKLAYALQNRIAVALEGSVEATGREQRHKAHNDRLSSAISSEQNRRVSVFGYTVGYLDSIAAVAPYYRGLEVGTRVHVGRFLSGVFSGPGGPDGGAASPRIRGAGGGRTDAQFIQTKRFRRSAPYFPGIYIKNPIIGYHYFDRGVAEHVAAGGTTTEALAAYRAAFKAKGLDLMTRALTTGATVLPGRSGDAGLDGPPLTGGAGE